MLNTRVTIILIEEQAWSISKRYEIPRKICITIYEKLNIFTGRFGCCAFKMQSRINHINTNKRTLNRTYLNYVKENKISLAHKFHQLRILNIESHHSFSEGSTQLD